MNLNKLFPEQKKLDEHILNKKGLHGQVLLKKKTVALICELYECVNEARFFKFWSEDQKPRTYKSVPVKCPQCDGEAVYFIGSGYDCDLCNGYGRVERDGNPILEEYADVIHFTISIANDIEYTSHKYIKSTHTDLNDLVIGITNVATIIPQSREKHHISTLVNSVIQLGYQLGFDEEQVIEAYYAKNEENHERQTNGY